MLRCIADRSDIEALAEAGMTQVDADFSASSLLWGPQKPPQLPSRSFFLALCVFSVVLYRKEGNKQFKLISFPL